MAEEHPSIRPTCMSLHLPSRRVKRPSSFSFLATAPFDLNFTKCSNASFRVWASPGTTSRLPSFQRNPYGACPFRNSFMMSEPDWQTMEFEAEKSRRVESLRFGQFRKSSTPRSDRWDGPCDRWSPLAEPKRKESLASHPLIFIDCAARAKIPPDAR